MLGDKRTPMRNQVKNLAAIACQGSIAAIRSKFVSAAKNAPTDITRDTLKASEIDRKLESNAPKTNPA
jgi:hypothetical protein